jgi:uncharacterized protein involved in type VI secretion and phage assembly
MQLNHSNKSIFSFEIPFCKDIHFKLISVKYEENLSSQDFMEVQLSSPEGISPRDLLNQSFHLSWDWNASEQHAHGIVNAVSIKPDGKNHCLLTLQCESPLVLLNKSCQSRHFTYKNLQAIIKEVLETAEIKLNEIEFHLKNPDPDRDFTAQHDETDLSFIERILHEVSWSYYLVHTINGVSFHVTDHNGGYASLPVPILFHPLDQGTKSIESIFEIVHQQDLINAKSDSPGMRAGQTFVLQNHPDSTLNQTYLIVSVSHDIQEQTATLRYQNNLILQAISQQFIPGYVEPDERINVIGIATVHSESDAPLLNEKGEYLLRSPHTNELTHPVRLTTPYAGQQHGMHFPLHENTQVLVAYLNGHPDQPVVLGALYNDEQRNIVTQDNHRQNLLITQSGHTLLLDDTPSHQKILLHTAAQHHRLLLDASEQAQKIELISETGEFKASISQGSEFKTENNHLLEAGESIQIIANQDCFFISDEANLRCEAAKDIYHQAGQDINLHADKNMWIRVDQDSETTIKGSMRTDIQSGDYQLKLSSGHLTHQAQGNIQLSTNSGDIVLKTAGASVTFQANGNIVFSAKHISLQAGSIDIHNAGEGIGN